MDSKNSTKASVYFLLLSLSALFVYGLVNRTKLEPLEVKTPALAIETVKEVEIGTDLLGRAELSYEGGTEGRHKNIELGIQRINGTILQPGEEFSFKKELGTTTVEDGFSEEKIFLNGEVTRGVGGGLCQVSTVLFRTAMASALPITERANHSFTVARYDNGLDATYSDPGPDFKFLNDTANPILIKGKTENLVAIFEIYGTKDGRIASSSEVEITNIRDILPTKYVWVPELEEDQSKCINTPQIGFTAKMKYEIIYADGNIKEKEFVSKYKPLQRVCYIVGDEIKTFDIKKMLGY
ncbi:MAG: Vancomycin B-type resistance protein VanW [Parcubacteria bacterium C7867-003]|nr:MAG: Vancomycin B-type resistance protein VanW [Parcubacteria bacterium C7867-003]